ncbi:hypothetical protein Zmor_021023 [Zophobas morio]|uniref:TIR domain-containing protein n=2 Tax=Zophobas morio TaxID=2755281 RepID=A0AA38I4N5_9CUCU|nr:hypothetical protein Zmor_021023 [Zophobas morio]
MQYTVTQSDDETKCFQPTKEEMTFLCPVDYYQRGGFEMSMTRTNEVTIQCAHLEKFKVNRMPKIQLQKINLLTFKSCPSPENGFQAVLDWFSTTKLIVLEIEYQVNPEKLTKEVFQNLQFLRYLKLGNNRFNVLEEDIFTNTPNLFALELRHNNLTQLSTKLFEELRVLEWLDLADNRIEKIPCGLFRSLKKLQYLHLWGNNIKFIDKCSFQRLSDLEFLDLSGNEIEALSDNVFKDLRQLMNLSLAGNKINAISSNMFRFSANLHSVILRNNPNLIVGEYLFSNFSFLQEVDMSNCNLGNISENIFENSRKMRIVDLRNNNLREIPQNLFRDLFLLETIDISHNRIKGVENTFTSLIKLKILFLQHNVIENITENTFSDLVRLEELNLEQNKIKYINPMAFYNNGYLRIINLSRNLYSGEDTILKDLVYLEAVDFSYNFIDQIEKVITLDNKVMLETLNLRGNFITKVTLSYLEGPGGVDIDLTFNNITVVSFKNIDRENGTNNSILRLGHNPLHCDCHNYDLFKYFNGEVSDKVLMKFDIRTENVACATPKILRKKTPKVLKLWSLVCPLENLTRKTGCPKICQCSWRPIDGSVIIDCANRNLTKFPKIVTNSFRWINFSNIEINVTNNNIVLINLTKYDEITKLYMSHNKLKTIAGIPRRLKVLELDHNDLSALSSDVLRTLDTSHLVNVSLKHNPWICTCGSEVLTNFVRKHAKIMDFKQIYCVNSTILLVSLNQNDLCKDITLIVTVVVISLLLLPAVFSALFYKFQQPIKVWMFSKNLCLWWVAEEDLDRNKVFDAFISYSSKDVDFIVETLIPELEKGPEDYKLCVDFRNWTPGELISSNIVKSINESKRTIIILSQNFLESVWGLSEFKQAHAEAMAAGRCIVIIIIYGNTDVGQIEDEELKLYLKTNTYLTWGEPYFWAKLRYALPHKNNNR